MFLKSLLNYVPYVVSYLTCIVPYVFSFLTCLTCFVLYVLSCLTCPRASCALCFACSHASRALCSTCSRTSHAIMSYVPLVHRALRPSCVNSPVKLLFSHASRDFFLFISISLAFLGNLQ